MTERLWPFKELARFLRYEDPEVRFWAADRMVRHYPEEATAPLAPYLFDEHGRRYLDGLSGLFTVQVGHGRADIARIGVDGHGPVNRQQAFVGDKVRRTPAQCISRRKFNEEEREADRGHLWRVSVDQNVGGIEGKTSRYAVLWYLRQSSQWLRRNEFRSDQTPFLFQLGD